MKFDSKIIKNIKPYTPGKQINNSNFIKLNTNENPYPPSPMVKKVLSEFDTKKLRLYPDPESTELKKVIAKIYNVKLKNVFVSNGSDETLFLCFLSFFAGKELFFSDITYGFYDVWAHVLNVKIHKISTDKNLNVVPKKFYNKGNIVLANPNAWTGEKISEVKKIADTNKKSIVIIDEAYADFSGETAIPLIKSCKNLIITRTLSKSYSLAGLRLGFSIGNEELINSLNKAKHSFNSYPVDRISEKVAISALSDKKYFGTNVKKILETKKYFENEIINLGFKVIPSKANFVLITKDGFNAEKALDKLYKKGILVRRSDTKKISNYLRISIGTKDDMKKLLEVIKNERI